MAGIRGTWLGPRTRALGELIEDVAEYVQMPDVDRARRRSRIAIQAAVRAINQREWWFTRTYHDIILIQGVHEYPIPLDYKRTISGRAFRDRASFDDDSGTFRYMAPEVFDSQTRASWARWQEIFTVRNPLDFRALEFRASMKDDLQSRWPFFRHHYWRRIMLPENLADALHAPSDVENYVVHYAQYEMARQFDREFIPDALRAYRDSWDLLRRDQKEQHTMATKQGA